MRLWLGCVPILPSCLGQPGDGGGEGRPAWQRHQNAAGDRYGVARRFITASHHRLCGHRDENAPFSRRFPHPLVSDNNGCESKLCQDGWPTHTRPRRVTRGRSPSWRAQARHPRLFRLRHRYPWMAGRSLQPGLTRLPTMTGEDGSGLDAQLWFAPVILPRRRGRLAAAMP